MYVKKNHNFFVYFKIFIQSNKGIFTFKASGFPVKEVFPGSELYV